MKKGVLMCGIFILHFIIFNSWNQFWFINMRMDNKKSNTLQQGTKQTVPGLPSRDGRTKKTTQNTKVYVMTATAYHEPGPTKSGIPAGPGIIAVDPRVIPLGTHVWIDGKKYLAADTGRLIKGHRIDKWLPTHEACVRWGRRNVKVVVYE